MVARATGGALRPAARAVVLGLVTGVLTLPGAGAHPALGTGTTTAPYHRLSVAAGSAANQSACANASVAHPAQFFRAAGIARMGVAAGAHGCPGSGTVASALSDSIGQTTLVLDFPVRLPANGTYHLRANWTFDLRTLTSVSVGSCPAKIGAVPGVYSEAYCYAATIPDVELVETLDDSTRGVEVSRAYLDTWDIVGWSNTTICNPSPQRPGCQTSAGPISSNESAAVGVVPPGSFRWNGATNLSSWTNLSRGRASDRYDLRLSLTFFVLSEVEEMNLAGAWTAHVHGALEAARPGTSVRLDSLTMS